MNNPLTLSLSLLVGATLVGSLASTSALAVSDPAPSEIQLIGRGIMNKDLGKALRFYCTKRVNKKCAEGRFALTATGTMNRDLLGNTLDEENLEWTGNSFSAKSHDELRSILETELSSKKSELLIEAFSNRDTQNWQLRPLKVSKGVFEKASKALGSQIAQKAGTSKADGNPCPFPKNIDGNQIYIDEPSVYFQGKCVLVSANTDRNMLCRKFGYAYADYAKFSNDDYYKKMDTAAHLDAKGKIVDVDTYTYFKRLDCILKD